MTPFKNFFNVLKKPWVIGLFTCLVIGIYLWVDKSLATYFYAQHLGENFPALRVFNVLGKWVTWLFVLLVAALFSRVLLKNKVVEGRIWYLFICVGVANLIVAFLKIILGRARPELFFMNQEFGFYGFKINDLYWSFPSGHSITVASLAAGVGILFPRYFYGAFVLALMVAFSRVMLHRHYLSDILVGLYLGFLIVGFLSHSLKNMQAKLLN